MKSIFYVFLAIGVSIQLAAAETSSEEEVPDTEDEILSPKGTCPEVDGSRAVFLPDTENRTVYYLCNNGAAIKLVCEEGTEFNENLGICTEVPDPDIYSPVGECPLLDGLLPTFLADSQNRSIYYACHSGVAILMKCPDGLEFNSQLNVCDWPKPVFQPIGECPEKDEDAPVMLGDGFNCAVYYVCYAGSPYMATCPYGLHFNSERGYCDFPFNVNCRDYSIPA